MKTFKTLIKAALLGFVGLFALGILLVALESPQDRAAREERQRKEHAERAEKDSQEAKATAERKAKEATERDHSSGAYVACKHYVRARLKAPATADFPWLDFNSWNLGGGKYKIVSYVDSQNGFGAMIRTNYICHAQTSDGRNFEVTELETR